MKAFKTKEALIEAHAQNQHKANLERGGVFKDGVRYSDLDLERKVSAGKVQWVCSNISKIIVGVFCENYIEGFGYVEVA